jgi:dephospho-CoA kinase
MNTFQWNKSPYSILKLKKNVETQTGDESPYSIPTLKKNVETQTGDESPYSIPTLKKNIETQTGDLIINGSGGEEILGPRIIGLTGRKRHGKDTVADYLVHKYSYKKMSFGAPIKEAITIFGFSDEQLNGEEKEVVDSKWGVTSRKVMCHFSDIFRNQMDVLIPGIGDNFLIEVIRERLKEIWKFNPNQKIIFNDIRRPSEVALIKELGGIFCRIKRNMDRIEDEFEVVHESELHIDKFIVDFEIPNTGSISDLYVKLDELFLSSNFKLDTKF